MASCPCGYFTDPNKPCKCSPVQIERYLSRVSGPLIDRIDLHVEVPPVPFRELRGGAPGTSSTELREQVLQAHEVQRKRFGAQSTTLNAAMSSKQVRTHCEIDDVGEQVLKQALAEFGLSARAHDKILRVSRTIADLAGDVQVKPDHISEAIMYRRLDRQM